MLVSVAGSAIIQIPQMARNRIAAEKAILDRAQKQPQHSHGASKQQPPPIVAMQNSARYGKAPRHGQPDIDQIGQQKTYGGGQRRGQAIQLPKKPARTNSPSARQSFAMDFRFMAAIPPPPNRPFQQSLFYHTKGGKASISNRNGRLIAPSAGSGAFIACLNPVLR